AGIFKPGRPAIVGGVTPDIGELLARRAREVGAKPVRVTDLVSVSDVQVSASGTSALFEMGRGTERTRLHTPLIGRHQAFNLAFTLALLHEAGPEYRFSLKEAQPLLADVTLPGRFQ